MRRARRSDGGQIAPLMLLVVMAAVGMLLVLGQVGVRLDERHRAQGAADAAALSGAVWGRAAARDIAERNGATLEDYLSEGTEVEVVVRIGSARARARAARTVAGGSVS